jgi:hypothetical protein
MQRGMPLWDGYPHQARFSAGYGVREDEGGLALRFTIFLSSRPKGEILLTVRFQIDFSPGFRWGRNDISVKVFVKRITITRVPNLSGDCGEGARKTPGSV